MNNEDRQAYRVIELGSPHGRIQQNEMVTDFDSLETHHPGANQNARMRNGVIVDGEPGRTHAFIDGEVQEVEIARPGRDSGLRTDQVLLKKDFMLEDPRQPTGSAQARSVDVPSPISGYIGRVSTREGLVDIYNHQGGDVIARVRHMTNISVAEGDTVAYGQALGTQGRMQTGKVHTHLEMDTRYHQQFESYVTDLTSGRLPVQAEFRANVQPRPVIDDGTFRLGESHDRIRDLQRLMVDEGYRAAGDRPLDQDGVYRSGMQGAVLDFQRNHGVSQTGNIDPSTLNFVPQSREREMDRQDYFIPATPIPVTPEPPTAPGHPDHRSRLPRELGPAVNQHDAKAFTTGDPDLDRLAASLFADDDAAISRISAQIEQSPQVQAFEELGHDLVAAQQREELQQQGMARQT